MLIKEYFLELFEQTYDVLLWLNDKKKIQDLFEQIFVVLPSLNDNIKKLIEIIYIPGALWANI